MKKLLMTLLLTTSFVCLASGELKCERANGISWVYETQDGTAAIRGMTNRPSGELRLPASLGGCPVKIVYSGLDRRWGWIEYSWDPGQGYFTCDYEAKDWVADVASVYIPDSVTNLYGSAFGCWESGHWDPDAGQFVVEHKDGWVRLKDVSLPDGCHFEGGVASAFSGTPFSLSEGFPDFICSRTGKTLYGVRTFEGQWSGEGAGMPYPHIPATVEQIADGAFLDWRFQDVQVVFEGTRPKVTGAAFREVYDNREWGGEVWTNQPVKSVCYIDGARGWEWGETWCNVRTYSVESVPSEYRVASAVRFAGGPHKGYRFKGQMKGRLVKQDDYELDGEDPRANLRAGGDVGTYRTTDGMFFALPVVGAKSKSEVKPFIHLLTAKQDMIAGVEVWTDGEMWNTLTGAVTADWESVYDGRLCERYFDDWASMTLYYRGWDKSLWPEGRSVAGRHWVFVKLNDLKYLNSSEWGGDYTFRVGLEGTSEWSRTLHVSIENESALNTLASTRGLTIRDVTHVSVDSERHNGGGDPFSFSEYELLSGAFPLSFRIDLPGPGTLYLYGSDEPGEDDSVAARDLEITGSYKGADREIYLDGYSSDNNPWWPTTNFCAYVGACVIRAVDVSQATTLQLRGKHPQSCEVDLVRLQFFPAGKKSVAIEATADDLVAWPLSDGGVDYDAMIYGRVTGTGVYSSGEYVHLAADPVAGELFDHWEVVLGSLPSDLDLRKQVLDFTMSVDLCGSPDERRQIVVRPVWKKRNAVTALPNVQGRGTVTGSGKYLAGTQVTLTATPASGYVFARWSDGETSATRRLKVVDADAEHVIYACFCHPEELCYTVVFKSVGDQDVSRAYSSGKVHALPKGLFPSVSRRFVGWACSKNGRRYDDGMLVFDLAQPGETVTMTAVWE